MLRHYVVLAHQDNVNKELANSLLSKVFWPRIKNWIGNSSELSLGGKSTQCRQIRLHCCSLWDLPHTGLAVGPWVGGLSHLCCLWAGE